MNRAALSLVYAEFIERTRDRWVLVISATFAVLASGVSLYARAAEANAAYLAGPSLVTLASLLVPLVALILGHDAIVGERERNTLGLLLSLPISRAEVIVAKYLGRLVALVLATSLGLGAAILTSQPSERQLLLDLLLPTYLLGATFLSLGMLISAISNRLSTATSLVVSAWFCLVFFYDLGLLALLVVTDGAASNQLVVELVQANPVGLYRIWMMKSFAGVEVFENLGIGAGGDNSVPDSVRWALLTLLPLGLSATLLHLRKVER